MRNLTFILAVLLYTHLTFANHDALHVYTRDSLSLNGEWKYIVDPYENGFYNYRYEPFDQQENPVKSAFFTDSKQAHKGELLEYNFDKAPSINVPGDWNTQKEKLYYYEGSVWFRKTFPYESTATLSKDKRAYLYFGAVNYRADVYLNGKKLGVHIGGFTPFYYDVTQLLKSENSLVVKVDNKRYAEAVPTLNTDWWNYGGITRDVMLVTVPKTHIKNFSIALNNNNFSTIEGKINIEGALKKAQAKISIAELGITHKVKIDENGTGEFSFQTKRLELWEPTSPKQYKVTVSYGKDTLSDDIGFRSITTSGKQLLLNGKPLFLRGISMHEEYSAKGGGRVSTPEQAEVLLNWVKELNSNFVRLAHYPHNEHTVRIAEKMGLLVWSEIPVYWTIQWKNENTYANAEQQLSAMIGRDINRASVIIWSLANETPPSDARNNFLRRLADRARSLDQSRLLSAAMEKHGDPKDPYLAIVEDPLADMVDIVSFNQYVGWYDGKPEKADKIKWKIPYNKPVFISEFGGGAKYGYHGDKDTIWTEEFQANLYQHSLKMIDKIDGYIGTSPWILADFRSPRRLLNDIQDDFNRKGVLSNKGEKKQAFYVLQRYYKSKRDLDESTR